MTGDTGVDRGYSELQGVTGDTGGDRGYSGGCRIFKRRFHKISGA